MGKKKGKTRRSRQIAVTRPATRRRIIYPARNQIANVEEVHTYGLDIKDFSVYLVGEGKIYHDDDTGFLEPGIEYQMAMKFIKNLHILSAKDRRRPILIHMKTCGGYWEEGMAIYDTIMACPNPVTILSYTHARSMSSIVVQAADKRVLMPSSYFLFHEGALEFSGTSKGVLSNVDWIKKRVNPKMLNIYTESLKRKGKFSHWSSVRIEKMLQEQMDKREDVFLTAEEAVEWGFVDEVFGSNDGSFDWERLRIYE